MARKRLYAVAWSWRKSRIVRTKKRGKEVLRVWKLWHERQGWKVRANGGGYMAYSPDYKLGRDVFAYPLVRSCSLHEYDPDSKERLA